MVGITKTPEGSGAGLYLWAWLGRVSVLKICTVNMERERWGGKERSRLMLQFADIACLVMARIGTEVGSPVPPAGALSCELHCFSLGRADVQN